MSARHDQVNQLLVNGTWPGLAGTHSIDDALAQARAAGFDGLELCITLEGVLTPQTTQAECESIRRAITRSGLIHHTGSNCWASGSSAFM